MKKKGYGTTNVFEKKPRNKRRTLLKANITICNFIITIFSIAGVESVSAETIEEDTAIHVNAEYLKQFEGDQTQAFDTALNSTNESVIIEALPNNEPWSIGQIVIRNGNKKVLFSDNVTVTADPEQFQRLKETGKEKGKDMFSLFLFSETTNVQFLGGDNVTFTSDIHLFNELGIKIIGTNIHRSENVLIKKLTITQMTYDGVYVGDNSNSVVIDEVSSTHNTRQAMSVTSATNLEIKNSTFSDTNVLKIKDNQGVVKDSCGNGLVFEVNEKEPILDNISVKNCAFKNNQVGLSISVSKATAAAKDISIEVADCLSKDNDSLQIRVSEWATSEEESVGGKITFENTVADGPNPIIVNMGKLDLSFNRIVAKISDEEKKKNNTTPLVKVVQTLQRNEDPYDEESQFTFNGKIYSDDTTGKCTRVFAYTNKKGAKAVESEFSGESEIIKNDGSTIKMEVTDIVSNPNAKISQLQQN